MTVCLARRSSVVHVGDGGSCPMAVFAELKPAAGIISFNIVSVLPYPSRPLSSSVPASYIPWKAIPIDAFVARVRSRGSGVHGPPSMDIEPSELGCCIEFAVEGRRGGASSLAPIETIVGRGSRRVLSRTQFGRVERVWVGGVNLYLTLAGIERGVGAKTWD